MRGDVLLKHGKNRTVFYSCEKYPKCDFSSFDLPTNEKCPLCGEMLYRKKGKAMLLCKKTGCGYKRELPPEDGGESAKAAPAADGGQGDGKQ